MNRRTFLTGAGAFALVGWKKVARASGLPDYYGAHLEHVVTRVRDLARECDDGFWFITDLHIKSNFCRSGDLLAELVRRTPLAKVVCGGDIVDAFAKGFDTDRQAVEYAIDAYKDKWVEPIRAAGGRVYTARGNHDFTVCHANATPQDRMQGFTLDGGRARGVIVDSSGHDIVTDTGNPEACYYYFDDRKTKIRIIVADTTDTQRSGDIPWGVQRGMQMRQLKWLAENAFSEVPQGYGVIVAQHIPVAGLLGNDRDTKLLIPFCNMLEAYQNRDVFEFEGWTCDFSSAHGHILIDVSGHRHCEMLTFQKGILHVTLPCDAAYGEYIERSRPWCGDLPRKSRGTVAEQTFDAIQFDRRRSLVHFTRVGGGQDRSVSLKPMRIPVGQSTPFVVRHLKGEVRWGCYDADRVTHRPNPKDRYNKTVKYHTTFATMTRSGVLTAIKPGEVVVVAMDADYNREIYPVTVA